MMKRQCPGLGRFASLPGELRNQIWDELPLESRFSFVRVSRQVYSEISPRLYKNIPLQFSIQPKYQYRSWLHVESSFEKQWLLQNVDDAIKRGFNKIPFQQLEKIRIVVEAPDTKDQGQIVCLYKKCLDLAGLLEHATNGLPHVEIILSDSASSKWAVRGKAQESIVLDNATFSQDHLVVLQAFSRLRKARSANISVPMASEEDNCVIEIFEKAWMGKVPFGLNLDPRDPWNDQELQEEMDHAFVDLDMELDLLSGPTAALVRLDRFASWYTDKVGGESKYEREYERIVRSWKGFEGPSELAPDIAEPSQILKRLQWRYGAMRAFDPDVLRRPDAQRRYQHRHELKRYIAETSNEWDRDRWHDYYGTRDRYGIPSFTSDDLVQAVLYPWRRGVCAQYEDPFREMLQDWLSDDDIDLDELGVAFHVFKSWHSSHTYGTPLYWFEGLTTSPQIHCPYYPCKEENDRGMTPAY